MREARDRDRELRSDGMGRDLGFVNCTTKKLWRERFLLCSIPGLFCFCLLSFHDLAPKGR